VWEKIRADLTDDSVPRRVFSREAFASAGSERVRRVIEEVGPVQVVVTARPLSALLTSQYSQFAQRGAVTVPIEEWAARVLEHELSDPTVRRFWQRFSIHEQVRRWAAELGVDRVTVVAPDPGDRLSLPGMFESLLGLSAGTIAAHIGKARTNRSLNHAELALLHSFRRLAADAGLGEHAHTHLAERIADYLRAHNPLPHGERPTLSADAVTEAQRQGAAIAAELKTTGARIVGDVDVLSR
jgi:hypothetical protein